MADEVQPPEVRTRKQPMEPRPCLAMLPMELHSRIINLALATGQDRDVSALAQTSKAMYFVVNHELYRLVVKHETFFLLHWAALKGRLGTLKWALAHGANPNQMRTSTVPPGPKNNVFRPLGWGFQDRTDANLDICVWTKREQIMNTGWEILSTAPASLCWRRAWFSCASLSTASSAQKNLLLNHYQHVLKPDIQDHISPFSYNNENRLIDLPKPLDENFSFPESMSPVYMDRRDTKISFLRLFQFWDTPLHIAAAHGQVEVTEVLLAHGGDVDCTATHVCHCLRDAMPTSRTSPRLGNVVVSYTPLHVAICRGKYKVAKVLVASGADRMAKIFQDNGDREWLRENALHTALSWHSREEVRFDYDFIEFLLKQGYAARLEERNYEDMTPLQIACQAIKEPAQMDVLRLLLRYGADPDSQCSLPPSTLNSRDYISRHLLADRATVGLWATWQGHFQVAKLLLDHGADAKARFPSTHETMLFVMWTRREFSAFLSDNSRWRMGMLLDALLARDTAKDLNTFDGNDRNFLMEIIRTRIRSRLPMTWFGEWESRLFRAGADIMAGADMGKVTPFERMITDVRIRWDEWPGGKSASREDLADECGKIAVILRASGIDRHRYRPTAMINRLWGIQDWAHQNYWRTGTALYILSALMKAGFSPAEVDEHGDTAMTSFLQHLLRKTRWVMLDRDSLCTQRWVIPMVMALLQEHGAALHKPNNKGLTAFDYLRQIINYDGEDKAWLMLRRVMRRSVTIALDDLGLECLKFHPMALYGRISGDSTILRLRGNPSRWLACAHLCRRGYCRGFSEKWRCVCTAIPYEMLAECDGDCCLPRDGQKGYTWLDDRNMEFETPPSWEFGHAPWASSNPLFGGFHISRTGGRAF